MKGDKINNPVLRKHINETKRLILQHEIIVPVGSKFKFNDTTSLFDENKVPKSTLEHEDLGADIAFALAQKLFPQH